MSQELFALTLLGFFLTALLGWVSLPAGLACALLCAWLFWRRADRFLSGLRDWADRVAGGDYGARFSREEHGQLAGLQLAFEAMAHDLKAASSRAGFERRQLETALDGIQDGVLVLDREGRALYSNKSLRTLFSQEPGPGEFYWENFREAEVIDAIKAVLAGQPSAYREFNPARNPDFALAMHATSLPGEDGRPYGAVALFYDRTEQRKMEKMRSDFVANVSHELRTPLSAIKASLETLQGGALEDPAVNRNFLDKAAAHAERLHELINDLLTLAAIEEDKRLSRVGRDSRAGLAAVMEEAKASLDGPLRRHQGSLEISLPAGLEVACDPRALRQVLMNLVENALKYGGEAPKIRVQAGLTAGGSQAEISVEDQGPGIPEADLGRVFERFYRVDKARARESGGSGLGLAIVKHLVENHGGSLGVENREGGGCRFWFKLPVAPQGT